MSYRAITVDGYARPEGCAAPGPAPMLQWLDIATLVVDDRYQRPIYGAGHKNVRAIAAAFQWSRFAPLIVAPVEGGRFAIIDGQHRATAALLCGMVQVPCQVITADAGDQAAAFRAINGQVTRIHSLAVQHAALMAGEAVPSSGRLGDGYERPAVIPPDPADVAADRFEREFVRAQRGRNVSWFNIANMTGRTVPYLKALYDDAPAGDAAAIEGPR